VRGVGLVDLVLQVDGAGADLDVRARAVDSDLEPARRLRYILVRVD
jgi:hypothetical protein